MTRRLAAALLCGILAWGPGCGDEPVEEHSPLSPHRWQPAPAAAPGSQADAEAGLLRAIGYLPGYEPGERGGGVTAHDPERAWPGVNLYTSGHAAVANLLDMEGRPLHTWQLDFRAAFPDTDETALQAAGTQFWRRVALLDDGGLIAIFDYHGVVRIDRESRLVWARQGRYHHDLWLGDGKLWVLRVESSAAGALPGRSGSVFEEQLVLLDADDGQELRHVSLLEAFRRSRYAELLGRLPNIEDVFHDNTIEILPAPGREPVFAPGRALVSLRNIHTIAVVDLATERVEWATTGPWRMQHEPRLLPSGRLLLFNNLGVPELSRVLEFEPFTQRIDWSYGGLPEQAFQSEGMGSVQRLPNGSTLVTDSFSGRAFEVTPTGQVVWRFDNPARTGEDGAYVAVVPELWRIPEGRAAAWLPEESSHER